MAANSVVVFFVSAFLVLNFAYADPPRPGERPIVNGACGVTWVCGEGTKAGRLVEKYSGKCERKLCLADGPSNIEVQHQCKPLNGPAVYLKGYGYTGRCQKGSFGDDNDTYDESMQMSTYGGNGGLSVVGLSLLVSAAVVAAVLSLAGLVALLVSRKKAAAARATSPQADYKHFGTNA